MAKSCSYLICILIFGLFGCKNFPGNTVISAADVFDKTEATTGVEVVKTNPGPENVVVPGSASVDTTRINKTIVVEEPEGTVNAPRPQVKKKIDEIYHSYVGVRELTGNNDGKQIDAFLRAAGMTPRNPYCSAFLRYCFEEAGVKTSITAWSPTAHNAKNIVFSNRKFNKEPAAGDAVCFYYPSKGRIAHAGFYDKRLSDKLYQSVEANTSVSGSRDGDGIYVKFRSYNSTYSITRWIK